MRLYRELANCCLRACVLGSLLVLLVHGPLTRSARSQCQDVPVKVDCNNNGLDDGCELRGPEIQLTASRSYPGSAAPCGLEVLDFNNDGFLDLGTTEGTSEISILVGDGLGAFSSHDTIETGVSVSCFRLEDVTGDGVRDLLVLSMNQETFLVMQGAADGGFGDSVSVRLVRPNDDFEVADFNGDGVLDIVVAGPFEFLRVLIGNGDGSFQEAETLQVAEDGFVEDVFVADFNRDGALDIGGGVSRDNSVGVLLGDGSGGFAPYRAYRAGDSVESAVSGDFNEDGHLDLAVANSSVDNIAILPGNGDGTFNPRTHWNVGGRGTKDIATVDFDGDGHLDLVTANPAADHVAVTFGHGDGAFSAPLFVPTQSSAFHVTPRDLDRDGLPDLAIHSANEIQVVINLGQRAFGAEMRIDSGERLVDVTLGDFDEDGLADLAVAHSDLTEVTLLVSRDGAPPLVGVVPTIATARGIHAADADGDGHIDLITVDYRSREFQIYFGDGNASFPVPRTIDLPEGASDVVVADVDRDGTPDLVVAQRTTLSVILGEGQRRFRDTRDFDHVEIAGNITFVDLDGDGAGDIVGRAAFSGGRGNGLFDPGTRIGFPAESREILVGDLDVDGSLDVAAILRDPGGLGIRLGTGGGGFGEPMHITDLPELQSAVLGDWNLDGFPDVAGATGSGRDNVPSFLYVSPGAGDGSFAEPRRFTIARGTPAAMLSGDLDGDERPDIIVAHEDGAISLFLNRTGFPSAADCNRNQIPDICDIASGVAVDVDANGIPDGCQPDCNANGIPDEYEVTSDPAQDRNGNGTPDDCEKDCDANGLDDDLDIRNDETLDCNRNGILDTCELQSRLADDCNENGVLDECEIVESRESVPLLTFPTRDASRSIASEDFDADGLLDLAVTESRANEIRVYLGKGTGHFQPVWGTKWENPTGIVAHDMNGDGVQDLCVVADSHDELLRVYIGRGDGRFDAGVTFPAGNGPTSLLAADFNGDAIADLATSEAVDGGVNVFLGLGEASFGDPLFTGAGERPMRASAGHLNDDEHVDLVTINQGSRDVSVLLGAGDGTFALSQTITLPLGDPEAVVIGEFAEGGALDLVLAAGEAGAADASQLYILPGIGDGTFVPSRRLPAVGFPQALAARDFDDDGAVDLGFVSTGGALTVYRRIPGGLFERSSDHPLGGSTQSPIFADFTDDGLIDLAYSASSHRQIALVLGEAGGGFRALDLIPGVKLEEALARDIDGDGNLDLVGIAGSNVRFFRGDGDGNFDVSSGSIQNPGDFDVADFNEDGFMDLAVNRSGFLALAFILGDVRIAVDDFVVEMNPPMVDLAAGDVDGDGRSDVVASNQFGTPPGFSVLIGTGTRRFAPAVLVPTVQPPGTVELEDLDSDGSLDIVAAGASDLLIHYGNGDGTFGEAFTYEAGIEPVAIAVGHLDGDANLDIAVANQDSEDISVYIAQGDRAFERKRRIRTGRRPVDIVIMDHDGDGMKDILTASDSRGAVWVHYGDIDHAFRGAGRIATGRNPVTLSTGDFNSDGLVDLATTFSLSPTPFDSLAILFGERLSPVSEDSDSNGVPDLCETGLQVPGDCDQDGELGVDDVMCLLGALFLGAPRFPCQDGAPRADANLTLFDWQDDGELDIADALALLRFLYVSGPPHFLGDTVDRSGCLSVPGCPLNERCRERG